MLNECSAEELDERVAIWDVERDVRLFNSEFELAAAAGAPMLAISIDNESVPISVTHSGSGSPFESTWRPFSRRPFPDARYEYRRVVEESEFDERLNRIDPDDARRTVFERARDFLTVRISALSDLGWSMASLNVPRKKGLSPTPTPGCAFSVSTNNPGLRVHWSGAYFIVPNFFSHPTSPVGGVLQAGSYVFGTDGGAYTSIMWDNSIVTIPGSNHVHLNY
jgi:hypothetical protein